MTREEIYASLQANPIFHLATVEGDQPRVRALLLCDGVDGIVFHTGKMRDLFRQLQAHPKVELCFQDYPKGVQIRVSGVVELVEDLALKQAIVAQPSREFLRPFIAANGYEPLAVYRIKDPVATTWTMAKNFAPRQAIAL
jgi:uncharacterized pyridoxamine 5'-phosphate oxidase family protein